MKVKPGRAGLILGHPDHLQTEAVVLTLFVFLYFKSNLFLATTTSLNLETFTIRDSLLIKLYSNKTKCGTYHNTLLFDRVPLVDEVVSVLSG